MAERLKKEFIELLESDAEFRYAVAGYLGLSEILKRLDAIEEDIRRICEELRGLREEARGLWENQNKLWEEVKGLREGQNKLWDGQTRLWEEVKSLREGQEKLWESQVRLWEEVRSLRDGQNKLWESQNKLWEGQNKLWEEVRSLREGQNKLWEEVRDVRITLNRVAVTLDRLAISVEEEAISHIRHSLREKLGIEVELGRLFIDTKEINIYGTIGDLCVIGEATVRLGIGLIDELKEKINLFKEKKPELMKPKIIKVIYADYATPDALEYAKKEGIWVLKWSGDLTPMTIKE